jgi:oxygen-dependent protoporphyrinogen oxidase
MKVRIGIVGAGLSGLATAFYLQQLAPSAQIVVFEANAHAGGTMQTHVVEGFRFEAGANGFLTNKPDTLELVRDCGLEASLLPSSDLTRRRFVYHDQLRELPATPPAFLKTRLLTWPQKLRLLAEPLVPPRRGGSEETVRQFGDRRVGKAFTSVFLDAMCAGIYGSTPERLSVEAAFPLVVALEREHGGLFRGMLAKRRRDAGPGGVLTSLRGGLGTLADHLVSTVRADWRWSTPVRAIERTGGVWMIVDDRGVTEVDAVAVCTPSFVAAEMVAGLDPGLGDALRRIEYSPIAVVGLGFRSHPHAFDGFGALTTTAARLPVLGVLWDSSVFPDRAPPGAKSLRVLIGGQRNPELARQDDAQLVRTARAGLAAIMNSDPDPDVTFVQRWDRGIPAYAPGHLANVERIFAALARWPGLELNSNAYRGVAMNDCVRNSRLLAGRLAGHHA